MICLVNHKYKVKRFEAFPWTMRPIRGWPRLRIQVKQEFLPHCNKFLKLLNFHILHNP
jgi:hypothetical protein